MDKIIIVGSSGQAKVVIDIVEQEGRFSIAGLIDRFRAAGESTAGYPILGPEREVPLLRERYQFAGVIVAIGDNFVRAQVTELLASLCPDLRFMTAIHPRATIARSVTVGAGSVVMAGAVINPDCAIGRGCVVNTGASLDHDTAMGDFASVAPRVVTGGTCTIGDFAAIGIGAVLSHRVRIGEHTVIGAGSTVLRDVDAFKVAFGTPARVVRDRVAGEKYL
jgi:sugar O-acyltransferase (sialic acid O-acetyltransferase NeuD family)